MAEEGWRGDYWSWNQRRVLKVMEAEDERDQINEVGWTDKKGNDEPRTDEDWADWKRWPGSAAPWEWGRNGALFSAASALCTDHLRLEGSPRRERWGPNVDMG
ncbi:hypothetical protein E4U51_002850 [Claviceps purpurea]|nr:hypothetical protein E4U51_002850 [Claviceps purpurea]